MEEYYEPGGSGFPLPDWLQNREKTVPKHYFVYYGHVNADNHDRYPTHSLVQCDREDTVIKMKKEFDWCDHKDCTEVTFQVIEGHRINLEPVEKVITYQLKRNPL